MVEYMLAMFCFVCVVGGVCVCAFLRAGRERTNEMDARLDRHVWAHTPYGAHPNLSLDRRVGRHT